MCPIKRCTRIQAINDQTEEEMKSYRFFSIGCMALIMAVAFSCADDEGVTYEVVDVSDRISGFASEVIGPGAQLTINGSGLDRVQRICIQTSCVPAKLFNSASESSIVFTVPSGVALGESDVLLVFPGQERGYANITVVALPAINTFIPTSATAGETVTVLGTSMNIVTDVLVGTTSGAITSQSPTMVQFTVPAGASTGKISLLSTAGTVISAADLVACPGGSAADCGTALTLNSSFEAGAGDNFDNWNKFNGGTKILATTNVAGNEVFRGTRALRVLRDGTITPGDQWRIQLASDYVAVEDGASYTVFAWVRATVAGASFRFSNQDAAQYGGDTAIPVNWTRISWTFTANAAQKRIVLDLNGTPQTVFFIDDVKLIKN
jgi:hypothetical protein